MDAMQGRWKMIHREAYGKIDTASYELLIVKDNFIMRKDGKIIATGQAILNPLATPKTIDLIGDNGRTLKGIYELHGDFYMAAYSKNDLERPKDFKGKDNRINIWRRE
jgi:uncharacterized protein (TIGR03067 family)